MEEDYENYDSGMAYTLLDVFNFSENGMLPLSKMENILKEWYLEDDNYRDLLTDGELDLLFSKYEISMYVDPITQCADFSATLVVNGYRPENPCDILLPDRRGLLASIRCGILNPSPATIMLRTAMSIDGKFIEYLAKYRNGSFECLADAMTIAQDWIKNDRYKTPGSLPIVVDPNFSPPEWTILRFN